MKKGKWICVHPTDCFTLLPVYECSECKHIESGYLTTEACTNCGSLNTVSKTDYKEMALFLSNSEQKETLINKNDI